MELSRAKGVNSKLVNPTFAGLQKGNSFLFGANPTDDSDTCQELKCQEFHQAGGRLVVYSEYSA
jgi:hypothetical protein